MAAEVTVLDAAGNDVSLDSANPLDFGIGAAVPSAGAPFLGPWALALQPSVAS